MNTIKNKKETWSVVTANPSKGKGIITKEERDEFVNNLNPEARDFLYSLTQKSKRMNEVFSEYFPPTVKQ